ncbi:Ig-like domain-containing protein [Hymenobacter elongatus]|uniref:Ig-like domain-containing protein n=1 Tax=Hymenobacter elongatus TaxID=877208 RepID=A0A4Z0PNX2_9BACT|nr:Ig-like domain-containing protein [Hymenobacter elongatus]TGE18016.1 Ig-like domain-containing protein [Hymenobacter elongatus]
MSYLYMRPLLRWLLLALWCLCSTTVYAQASKPFKLHLDGFRGNIQWEQSADAKNWSDVPNGNVASLSVTPTQTTYYRAKVSEAGCVPTYSDLKAAYAQPDVKYVPVTFGADVSAAGRQEVEGFYSALESTAPTDDAMLPVAIGRKEDLFFALGGKEQVLLMGFTEGEPAELSIENTGVALVRFAINPLGTGSLTPAQLKEAIRKAPAFSLLRQAINQALSKGESSLDSDDAIAKAGAVAAEVVKAYGGFVPNRGVAGASVNQATALPYFLIKTAFKGNNIWLEDEKASANVKMFNDTRLYWEVVTSNEQGQQIQKQEVKWEPFKFFEFLPFVNPPETAILQGHPEKFTVTIGQNTQLRGRHAAFLIQSAILTLLEWAGDPKRDPEKVAACVNALAPVIVNKELSGLITQADGQSARQYLLEIMDKLMGVTDSGKFWIYEYMNQCQGKNLPGIEDLPAKRKFAKLLSRAWTKMQVTISFSATAGFAYQFFYYYNHTASVTLCKNNGTVSECVDRVNISDPTASNALPVGTTLSLSGTVIGEDGTDLTSSHTITWQSSNPALATVNAQGVVTGIKVGKVDITGTCGGKKGTLNLTVTPFSQLVLMSTMKLMEIKYAGPYATTSDTITAVGLGQTLGLFPRLVDENGNEQQMQGPLEWVVSRPTVASVTTRQGQYNIPFSTQLYNGTYGEIKGLTEGEMRVRARYQGVFSKPMLVKVVDLRNTYDLTAVGGEPVPGITSNGVEWISGTATLKSASFTLSLKSKSTPYYPPTEDKQAGDLHVMGYSETDQVYPSHFTVPFPKGFILLHWRGGNAYNWGSLSPDKGTYYQTYNGGILFRK